MKVKINVNIAEAQMDNVHGRHVKDMLTIHETVSPNYKGIKDVIQVSDYLDNKDYGIHGVVDNDGNKAWALGLGNAIFYHTDSSGRYGEGFVNSRSIGIECVSRVMLDYKGRAAQTAAWLHMTKELNALAQLIAAASAAHPIPLVTSNGKTPGITTHWLVTHEFGVDGGHVDAWPVNNGGYFPLSLVIKLAKRYKALGYRF